MMTHQEAEKIYREAQKELNEASRLYGKKYDIVRHVNMHGGTNNFPEHQVKKWKEEVATLMKEQGKHRRKHKALMKKIKWDPVNSRYRMKTPAEKKAEAARRK
jgi:hypothetical protein